MNDNHKHLTLEEDPRTYLLRRATRLVKLLTLKAPTVVIYGEVTLVEQALEVLLRKEPPLYTPEDISIWSDTIRMRKTIEECMILLADVPGDTLEKKLTTYIGEYIALQIKVGEYQE